MGEIVELGLQSSGLSSEEVMAKVLIENRSDRKEEDAGCGLEFEGLYLPSINPRGQVFEGKKDLFHLGLESLLKDSSEIKCDGG